MWTTFTGLLLKTSFRLSTRTLSTKMHPRYSAHEDRLSILDLSLRWGHLVPTAPDTLTTYPFVDNDPFVVRQVPHVFFAGNQPEFGSRLVTNGASDVPAAKCIALRWACAQGEARRSWWRCQVLLNLAALSWSILRHSKHSPYVLLAVKTAVKPRCVYTCTPSDDGADRAQYCVLCTASDPMSACSPSSCRAFNEACGPGQLDMPSINAGPHRGRRPVVHWTGRLWR